MNGEIRPPTLHIPLAILALAFAVVLASQVGAANQSKSFTQWQIATAQKSIERMKTLEEQYAEALKNRETGVAQSNELQAQLEALLNDLLDLAEEDPEAKEIVQKWNVQRNEK